MDFQDQFIAVHGDGIFRKENLMIHISVKRRKPLLSFVNDSVQSGCTTVFARFLTCTACISYPCSSW